MKSEENVYPFSQLIAKCWADEAFKQKLLADPAATLKAEGLEVPAGLSLKVVENTDKLAYLVIPPRPTELSEEDLDRVAGGDVGSCSKANKQTVSWDDVIGWLASGAGCGCRNVRW